MKSHAQALAILQPAGVAAAPGAGASARAKRKRVRRPAAAPTICAPVDAVIVAVDPGKANSGWSIHVRDRLVQYGEVRELRLSDMRAVFAAAELLATLAGVDAGLTHALPIVLVLEKAPPAGVIFKSMFASAGAVHAARQVWLYAWRDAGYTERRSVGVAIGRWRSRVLGRGWGRPISRDAVRAQEQRVAPAYAERAGLTAPIGEDAAPAILIGVWAARAPEVRAAIEPRARKASRNRAVRAVKGTGFVQGTTP